MHVQAPTGVEPPSKPVLCISETVVVQFTYGFDLLVKQSKNIAHPAKKNAHPTLKNMLIRPKKIAHPT